ncbi:hypothetical protein FS749_001803 [Ceratobasidium sp. UAMH 11750]|nr:hypothetical protein FS749_001803 [Ceratobasidium sp. UAMH 11750]
MPAKREPTTIFSEQTLVKKGLCPVTKIKGQAPPIESHSLYFEQHGRGPEKILFIMGLNSSSFSWQHQVEHFGPLDKYSILVFDNRGVGNSDAPRGPYTTSGMAEDVIVLLDHIGLTFTKDPADKVRMIMDMVFPLSWLAEPSLADPSITNREAQTRLYMTRILATAPQTLVGTLSQMAAGLTHYVSADRLRQIAKDVPKIVLVTGDEDNLVPPRCSEWIQKCMGPQVELVKWKHTGHALQIQRPERFNALVERVIEES